MSCHLLLPNFLGPQISQFVKKYVLQKRKQDLTESLNAFSLEHVPGFNAEAV